MTKYLVLLILALAGCSSKPENTPTYYCLTPVGPVQARNSPDDGIHVKVVTDKNSIPVLLIAENDNSKLRVPFSQCVEVTDK
jgi:hypothetical protein